ncbi:RND family transporter, partial [Methanosarcinales archaeon]
MSIRRFYERLGIFVETHGRLIIVGATLLFILSLFMAQQIEFATGTDTFVDEDSRLYQDYEHLYLENFRTDTLVVMVSSDDITSPEVLEAMDSLESYIREVEHVVSVSS